MDADAFLSAKPSADDFLGNAKADAFLNDSPRELLNKTLNFAGVDTKIPINQELSAYLTNFGAKMAGSFRGVKQFLGLDKVGGVSTEAANEMALRRLERDPEVGGYATAGGVIGSGFDPVTLALPVAKAKTLVDMAKYGAISGAAAGALNPLGEGDSRTVNAAAGGAAGAVLSPLVGAVATRGRLPLRAPGEPPAASSGGIGLAPVDQPLSAPLTGQEATKAAVNDWKSAQQRALAPDLTDPEVPIQEVLRRRQAAGEIGNIDPRLAIQMGGGAVGAVAGAMTADEGASPAEIAARALLGGVGGWQLAKYGANKIAAYRPATPSHGAPPVSEAADSVNVIGDTAEQLFKTQVSPSATKGIASLAKDFFTENPGLRDPTRLISDDIHRYVAGGAIPAEKLAEHGLTPETFADVWRKSISDHARSLGYLAQVMREANANMTPEQRAAIQAAGGSLEDAAYVRPFWKKLTDFWRGMLVTQPATAVRNAITQTGRVGLDVIQAPIDHWLQRITGRPVTTQPLDGFEEMLSLFQKNKANTDKILQAFPKEGERLFNNYLSDVAGAANVAKDGKIWGAIDSGVQMANILNRTQEFIIRRGIFQNALDKEMRNRGGDLGEIIKTNALGSIPQEAVRAAVETSLNKTFATTPEWGTMSRKLIDAINAIPGANLAVPFPRFMYNAIKFQYEYSPMGVLSYLSPTERAAFANGDVQKVSKAIIGSGLFGAAMLMRNSEHAGEKWYEYTKDDGGVVDLRPFNPFASYLFAADVLKKQKDGTLYKLTSNDIAQGLLSTNMRAGTGLYLLDNALNMMSKTADEKKLGAKGAELAGDFLGGFVTPLAPLRDAYDQITDGQSVMRDTRQDPFLGPIKSRIPGVSQSMPEAKIPTREGPKVTENPGLRQITGLTVSGPKNALEKELDRLGFERREIIASTGDKELDSKYAGAMGKVSERLLVPIVESEKFQSAPDTIKGVVLHEVLDLVRGEVKKGINESLPADKQLAIEIKKLDPRTRLMLKEFAPQLFSTASE